MTTVHAHLDALPEDAARRALLRCCGSQRWVDAMVETRPFASDAELFAAAERIWWDLDREDWLEAFSHHPRIGDRKARRAAADTREWSRREQAGTHEAAANTLEALEEGNRAYEERFGHVFLICAQGLGAEEMLAELRRRLEREPEEELRLAAGEQQKITRLRLERLAREAEVGK